MRGNLLRMLLALLLASLCMPALAGALWKQDIERLVGGDYVVGEIQSDLPVWPLYLPNPSNPDAKPELKAYAFETYELTTVRGYSGKAINLLVVMDLNGSFLSVQLLEQKEPLFVRDDEAARLHIYTRQHNGLSLRHTIEVGKANDAPSRSEQAAHLRGIHTGTITAKAITRTILSAAANVALARLKLAGIVPDNGKTVAPAAAAVAAADTPKPAAAAASSPATAGDKAGSNGTASVSAAANSAATPTAPATVPAPTAPSSAPVKGGPQATPVPPPVVNITTIVSTPPRVMVQLPGTRPAKSAAATAAPPAGSTTAAPSAPNASTVAPATGKAGTQAKSGAQAEASTVASDVPAAVTADAAPAPAPATTAPLALALPQSDEPEWLAQWQSRRGDIAVLVAGLALLSVALVAQKRFSADARWLRLLRTLYLLFTVGFIGWYAQGQLTIVNITAAIESLTGGGDLAFLMNDPMTVILWAFVGLTLLVWGRGTFCGWLCPFGALQELISLIANTVGVRQRRLRAALDAKLKWVKYIVLAVIVGAVFAAPDFASWAVEIEPFKTAISSYFVRSWPYVLWAAACVALSIVVYRGYCRYICPLGAALATLGFLRRWDWIARRTSCGTPCQSCRHRCEYQAIDQAGKINYRECFQCLDCVSIYQDDHRCLPLILEKKQAAKVIPIREVPSP